MSCQCRASCYDCDWRWPVHRGLPLQVDYELGRAAHRRHITRQHPELIGNRPGWPGYEPKYRWPIIIPSHKSKGPAVR